MTFHAKSLRIKIKKMDGFFKTHNGIRCLALLGYEFRSNPI